MAETDPNAKPVKPFWLPELEFLAMRLRGQIRRGGQTCWMRLCGVTRQYRTVRLTQWQLLPNVLNRVLLALRGLRPSFTSVGAGGIWRVRREPADPEDLAKETQVAPVLADLRGDLEQTREQSFRRVIGIIGQVDRAMAVGGDVTAPAVLRAGAPLDAAALATVLGLNLPSPPAAVSSPTESLVWRRRPRLNPWKL